MKRLLLLGMSLICAFAVQGQQAQKTNVDIALEYLQSKMDVWGLDQTDINSVRVTDMYTSQHTAVTHVYFVQQYHGIDIAQGTFGAHIRNGSVFFTGDRLVKQVASMINTDKPRLTAEDAVSKTLSGLGVELRGPLAARKYLDAHRVVFEKGVHALQDFTSRLVYIQDADQLKLAWEVTIEPAPAGDLWSVAVDAQSGDVLSRKRLTIHCTFPEHYLANPHQCGDEIRAIQTPPNVIVSDDGAQYRVFALPDESPKHGPHQLIPSPADNDASPQGWHDTDGQPGAEHTITRGNNVHAFIDRNGDNNSDAATNGGAQLIFDFPYHPDMEPSDYMDAATTNLFYMNNMMHDFSYHYGFDEFSGNFQTTNFLGLGEGGDHVLAHAQYGADNEDPPLNNATFGTPGDGGSGRMRMYLWSQAAGNRLLRVESPAEVAGSYQTATTATDPAWGALITATPLTGEVVIVNDGSGNATQGCNPLINGTEVTGKIALIDRGNCEFGRKALRAQNEGAIGFIICNFEDGLVTMGAGAEGEQVTIPGVFISNSDCQKIRAFAGSGLTVSFVNEAAGTGPAQRDGSLDNGIIAHEYGHGISNRLTGGPNNAGCLFNYDHDGNGDTEDGEQMGEGWSDFFALVTTVRPGDTRDVPRGVATYSTGQETDGVGLRSYAYSPDMNINPLTYDDIAFQSVPHGIGTVWCSVLWDLYWALSDEYGFDPDLYRGSGGNNLAIQMVMDGMKYQVCNPGLVDGRDAILVADMALTGGANQSLIWHVFARRGLGYSAKQGEERFRHDNSEAFDLPPFVIKELKIVKHMTPYIQRGETVEVELWVVNHKEDDVTDVVVTDIIPDEAAYVTGTANRSVDQQANVLMFEIGDLASGDTVKIMYQLSTDPHFFSERYFRDDVEGDFYWDAVIDGGPELLWLTQEFVVNNGTYAWAVENIDTTSDQSLVLLEPITLPVTQPALMFYQNYDTERFFDAGIVQISDDGGLSWDTPGPEKIVRGDYSGKILFSLFAIPRIKAWHGNSDGWVQTVVDLSEYAGKDILIRFRFASDGNTSGVGWFLDDIELVDLYNFNSEACVTSDEGDHACAEAARKGTLVASDISTGTAEGEMVSFDLNVFPNPARNSVNIGITSEYDQHAEISLVNSAGQLMWSEQTRLPAGSYHHRLDTHNLPDGFYFVHVKGERDQAIRKIIVQ